MSLENVTVNGVPLALVLDKQDRVEKHDFRKQELLGMGRVVRPHGATKRNWSVQSGSRSGRGRVLMQNGVRL